MKKLLAVLFVLMAFTSNVVLAKDCHPDEKDKEHCEKH
jgi:hypothetical protein